MLPFQVRVGLVAIPMKKYSRFPNLQDWSLTIRWFIVGTRTHIGVGVGGVGPNSLQQILLMYFTASADWPENVERRAKLIDSQLLELKCFLTRLNKWDNIETVYQTHVKTFSSYSCLLLRLHVNLFNIRLLQVGLVKCMTKMEDNIRFSVLMTIRHKRA